eukprot:TRINITY_DN6741_c0_g1_i3.p1 TRINITY_DN6741_c0_g1~~TRINITY_DN6741_c0_g1_i3.p1  ORF type:complete len:102 (-),score=12.39 TRINITY_DN6741_c0_g1_i3:119-424(-)
MEPLDLMFRGKIKFVFEAHPHFDNECSIFVSTKWVGDPIESDELKPQWFDFDSIPYDGMWQDDRIWLPEVLSSNANNVYYTFWFDSNQAMSRWIRHNQNES